MAIRFEGEDEATTSIDLIECSPITAGKDSKEELIEVNDDQSKPMVQWVEADFPDKPMSEVSHYVNRFLQRYSNVRRRVFRSKNNVDDGSVVCSNVIGEVCLLLFLLFVDAGYVAYCITVNKLSTEDDIRLLWLSVLVWLVLLWKILKRLLHLDRGHNAFGGYLSLSADRLTKFLECAGTTALSIKRKILLCLHNDSDLAQLRWNGITAWIPIAGMMAFFLYCITKHVIMKNLYNLISLSGIALNIFICIIISVHPGKILWQTVYVGLFIQLVLAVITLQTQIGRDIFYFLADRVTEFLDNSKYASEFVFGASYSDHYFAFAAMPVTVFFSSFIAIAYHFGVLQLIVTKPSAVIQKVMGTTGPETINAVANVFASMTESPMITRPYMPLMTNSELHAVFVNGFASIAGGVMAIFIGFGVPANHLLIACVMSAPAALAVAKVIYPENKVAPLASLSKMKKIKSPYRNVLEAAATGAMDAIPIIAAIIANLIAFLSIYNFFNQTLTWLGYRAGMNRDLTFELIFSYILWPIAFTMGIPTVDCAKVAELIGVKIMVNPLISFQRLGIIMKDVVFLESISEWQPIMTELANGSYVANYQANGTAYERLILHGVIKTRRAEVISTYAFCGYANIVSIGIMLGTMTAILPARRSDMSAFAVRALIGGNVACFLTGCFAGLFYDDTM